MPLIQLNMKRLKHRMMMPITDYWNEMMGVGGVITNSEWGNHSFLDRGADILAVAHLDTVNEVDGCFSGNLGKEVYVFSPGMDDRLGAYIILDYLLPAGVKCDVLLTEGEEKGKSTARYFEPPNGKKYKWVFSFDRSGTDVVTYQYKETNWLAALESSQWKVGVGSFSDIVYLQHLGVCAANFGAGYYQGHDDVAHCVWSHVQYNVARMLDFYARYRNITFPYVAKKTKPGENDWKDRWGGKYGSYVGDGNTEDYSLYYPRRTNFPHYLQDGAGYGQGRTDDKESGTTKQLPIVLPAVPPKQATNVDSTPAPMDDKVGCVYCNEMVEAHDYSFRDGCCYMCIENRRWLR